MNTKNSKTNEPHRFSLSLVDELNLKNPNKNMAFYAFITHGKSLNQHTTTIIVKFLLQLGMMNFICLVDIILL